MNLNLNFNASHLGWNAFFEHAFQSYRAEGFDVGRVALEHKHMYRVYTEHGEVLAEVSGKLRFNAVGREDFPAVGDWVVMRNRLDEGKATIQAILPRKTKFSRKEAGFTSDEQIVAANVDTVFLVSALNHDFNIRRIERYLIMAWESGATPVMILSKADLCDDVAARVAETAAVAPQVPIHVISSVTKQGLASLEGYLTPGMTIALMGSSGVGKSTLSNALFGTDILQTAEVREGDDRGRHTTTHRELIVLPSGALLIDTPGMRELQLLDTETGLATTFEDIEALAEHCRYRDCKHRREPDCAVQDAIESGSLDEARLANYIKLQRELAFIARKEDERLRIVEKSMAKKRAKVHRKR